MNAQHTPGRMKAGISLVGGVKHFTVVPHGSEQTVGAMCGLVGANDEPESIENTRRIAASWNICASFRIEALEALPIDLNALVKWHTELEAQRDTLLAALRRLESAAQCRDNTMGDQCRLIEVKAELANAAKKAREAIKQVEAAL